MRKVFCDGSNLLSDIDLGTQFPNKIDPTSKITISSFEMKLGNERTAKLDGKVFNYKSLNFCPKIYEYNCFFESLFFEFFSNKRSNSKGPDFGD